MKKKYYIKRTKCPRYLKTINLNNNGKFTAYFTNDKEKALEYDSKKQARFDLLGTIINFSKGQNGNPMGYHIKEE